MPVFALKCGRGASPSDTAEQRRSLQVPDELISMRWRFSSWPQGHFSAVRLELVQKEDCTQLSLVQEHVPKAEADRTRDGWQRHYWDSLKRTFGFGAILF